jgi:hypothetical protein
MNHSFCLLLLIIKVTCDRTIHGEAAKYSKSVLAQSKTYRNDYSTRLRSLELLEASYQTIFISKLGQKDLKIPCILGAEIKHVFVI